MFDSRQGRAVVRGLGHLEASVMDRLWRWNRPVVVREVVEDLRRERKIAYTTVMTVMDNLHNKGVLARERDGRAYRYRPARSREEFAADLLEEVLQISEDRTAALLRFVERLSSEEIGRLRRALARAD
ncbi:MAG TPA: BlaI/MecI/CopY family transcriptional regulator [Jiangellaceae bacterium]